MSRGHEFQQGGLGDLPLDLETGHRATYPVPAVPGAGQRQGRPAQLVRGESESLDHIGFTPWNFKTIVGSKQYLNANATRRYLLVQNNSTADIWVNFSMDAGLGIGILTVAGGSAEWYAAMFGTTYGPINALYFWAAAAGGIFTVLEG